MVTWDEAFAFNRPVVLDADTVLGLAKSMRRQSDEAATTLNRWSLEVDTLTGLCAVPDFEGLGVDLFGWKMMSGTRMNWSPRSRHLLSSAGTRASSPARALQLRW